MTKHLSPRHDPNGPYVSATVTPWGGSVHLSTRELSLREALLRNPKLTMAEARKVSGMTEAQLSVALDRIAQYIAPFRESVDTVEPTQCCPVEFELRQVGSGGFIGAIPQRRLLPGFGTYTEIPFDGAEAGLETPEDYEAA